MKKNWGDAIFAFFVGLSAWSIVILTGALFIVLTQLAMQSMETFGWTFLFSAQWDPVKEIYGALPFIYGTLVSSLLALLIAIPLAMGIALYLADLAPYWIRQPLGFMIELLAAIPSVIYGIWGIFVLVPWLRDSVQPFLGTWFGFLPLFQGPMYGVSMLAAGVILSIMILPTITAISRDVFLSVPASLKEAALAIGATRWETIRLAFLPYGRTGVLGAIILGLGRALGETMAVTMVIGNRHDISASLFAPAHSMASVIANEFTEATTDLYLSALIEVALILFVITLILNALARVLVWTVSTKMEVRLA